MQYCITREESSAARASLKDNHLVSLRSTNSSEHHWQTGLCILRDLAPPKTPTSCKRAFEVENCFCNRYSEAWELLSERLQLERLSYRQH